MSYPGNILCLFVCLRLCTRIISPPSLTLYLGQPSKLGFNSISGGLSKRFLVLHIACHGKWRCVFLIRHHLHPHATQARGETINYEALKHPLCGRENSFMLPGKPARHFSKSDRCFLVVFNTKKSCLHPSPSLQESLKLRLQDLRMTQIFAGFSSCDIPPLAAFLSECETSPASLCTPC